MGSEKNEILPPSEVTGWSKTERDLYQKVYKEQYPSTGYITDLAEFIMNTARRGDALLDIGCGHGKAVRILRERGYRCLGVDITLDGARGKCPDGKLPSMVGFSEAPLWKTLFKNNQFDYTFSTDVLEHLPPEMVEASIKEIYRITRVETFHVISLIDDVNFENLHKTIKPITWWREQFAKYNFKAVDTHLVDPETFCLIYHFVNKRRVG